MTSSPSPPCRDGRVIMGTMDVEVEDATGDRVVTYLCDLEPDAVADVVATDVADQFGLDDRALNLLVRAGGNAGPLVRRMLREAARATVVQVVAGAAEVADQGSLVPVTSLASRRQPASGRAS